MLAHALVLPGTCLCLVIYFFKKSTVKVPGAGGTKVNLGTCTSKKKIEFPTVIVILRVSLSPSPVKYQKFLTCGHQVIR